eukprot:EG_transcript_3635
MSPSPSPLPVSPSESPSPLPAPSSSVSPTIPSPSPLPVSPSQSPSQSAIPSASPSGNPSDSPSASQSPVNASPSASQSTSPNASPSPSPLASSSPSPGASVSPSSSASPMVPSPSPLPVTPSDSPSPIASASQSSSPVPPASPSPSPSPNPSPASPSPSPSPVFISPSPVTLSPSPSPLDQSTLQLVTSPNTPIAAFGGTPVTGLGVAKAIDGTTTPFSIQGTNVGFSVSLTNAVALTALRLYTSNESASQDPASYELYGSNDNSVAVSSRRVNVSAAWVFVASGNVALPAARNAAGQQVSTALNYVLVQFANTQAYTNYLVVFPTLVGSSGTSRDASTTMSVGEVELLRSSTTSSSSDNPALFGLLALLVIPLIAIAVLVWYLLRRRRQAADEQLAQDMFAAPAGYNGWYPPVAAAALPQPTPAAAQTMDRAVPWVYPVVETVPAGDRVFNADRVSYPVWGAPPPDPVVTLRRSMAEVYRDNAWHKQLADNADLFSDRSADPPAWDAPVSGKAATRLPWPEQAPAPWPADKDTVW